MFFFVFFFNYSLEDTNLLDMNKLKLCVWYFCPANCDRLSNYPIIHLEPEA